VPDNIEIKARVRDLRRVETLAESLAGAGPEIFEQEDTFFKAQRGRLKLRVWSSARGELIFYARPDTLGPKHSEYRIAATSDPERTREVLAAALGTAGTVRKTRFLYRVGQTRIHVDDVAGLGHFIELEVVLHPGQSTDEGERIVRDLMARLEIGEGDLIAGAYVDMKSTTGAVERQADG